MKGCITGLKFCTPSRLFTGLLISLTAACGSTPPAPEPVQPEKFIPEVKAVIPSRPFPEDSLYDLLVAEFAVRRSRYDLALGNYLKQAHRTRDTGVTARATRLAQFLRADKATLDAAQLWLELEPENPEAQYTTAAMLAKSDRPLEAIRYMVKVLEQGDKTNFTAIIASSLELPEKQRAAIEAAIDKLLERYPDNSQLLLSKALLLQKRNQPEPALALTERIVSNDANEIHAILIQARLLQQLKRNAEALALLKLAIETKPEDRRLRLRYGRMLMHEPANIELAKQQFEILLASTPNDADLLLSLGLINKQLKRYPEALAYFQKSLATGKRSAESHYYLGLLTEKRGDYATAIDHYRQIPPGENFIAITARVSTLYIKQQQMQQARDYLQQMRTQHAEYAIRLYLLESELLMDALQIQQGFELLSAALLVHPKQGNLLYARSMFSEKLNDLPLMEQDLRDLIRQDNNNAAALNALGYVLANKTDRLDEAYQLISRALALRPDDPAITDSLGWLEYRRGNLHAALPLLEKAFKAYPDHEVAAHLGEVLWKLGQRQRALDIWQKALLKKPDSPILREAVGRLSPQALSDFGLEPLE